MLGHDDIGTTLRIYAHVLDEVAQWDNQNTDAIMISGTGTEYSANKKRCSTMIQETARKLAKTNESYRIRQNEKSL